MTVVGLVLHMVRPQAAMLAKQLIAELTGRGVEVRIPEADAAASGLDEWGCPEGAFGPGLSLAFSLGGDGTMLRTVEMVVECDVPVLGVNVGNLGYLTAVVPEDLDAVVDRVLSGDFDVEERMTVEITVEQPPGPDGATKGPVQHYVALNEAVLEKSSSGHTVRLGVSFKGELFINYVADGLIVASPTGSTAYAFSARGPIVSPQLRALVVVPVSPHMLFDRSMVLDASETIRIEVLDGRPAVLFVDGRNAGVLPEGSVVTCREGTHPARFVTFGQRDFHRTLRSKFGLGTPVPHRSSSDRPVPGDRLLDWDAPPAAVVLRTEAGRVHDPDRRDDGPEGAPGGAAGPER